jgi:putative FmdB family regulatory protein
VPVYEFRCDDCGSSTDLLLPRGDTGPRACPACGGTSRHRFARVAVTYRSWGFSSTDRLVADRAGGRPDFDAVRRKAEQISDE